MFTLAALLAQSAAGQAADTAPMTDLVMARRALMAEIERLMRPIDTLTVAARGATPDPVVSETAQTLSVMLAQVPHLFPAASHPDRLPGNAGQTLALPALWANPAGFAALARAGVAAAEALHRAASGAAQQAAAGQLRATCDACHAVTMAPYAPDGVREDDLNFDFDSLFKETN